MFRREVWWMVVPFLLMTALAMLGALVGPPLIAWLKSN
jgi:hypothetical protein